MSAVQIAGCSGAGKSTVAAMLARRGLAGGADNQHEVAGRFTQVFLRYCPAPPRDRPRPD
jgi:predicted ATPase